MTEQTLTKGKERILSLMRCKNCMRNIASDEEVWRNRIGKETKKGVFCTQKCAIDYLDKSQETSLNNQKELP